VQYLLAACIALVLLALPVPASAHPGTGVVRDRQGNVYYTDLVHIWRIAPDGRKSIAVRDVHSHELTLDREGNLLGEDSKYLGGERWRHRVWKRTPDGRVTDVVPWTDGFWRDYGLVHDAAGAHYWVNCPERVCTIRKRTPEGRTTVVAPTARFNGQINWMAAGPNGSLYVIDAGALRVITREGLLTTVKETLGESPFGLWPDGSDVLVAVYGDRAVKRISPEGRATVAARTPAPWGPSGVTVAPNGDLWILEYSTANEARVRRVATDGKVTVF
jgi:hypothetical protein